MHLEWMQEQAHFQVRYVAYESWLYYDIGQLCASHLNRQGQVEIVSALLVIRYRKGGMLSTP